MAQAGVADGAPGARVITNAFSQDTDNHGITYVVVTLGAELAARLALAVRGLPAALSVAGLGEADEILFPDAHAVYVTSEAFDESGLEEFAGEFGLLVAGDESPAGEEMASSHVVVQSTGVFWTGRTTGGSIVDSQLLPLDFLERVAAGDRDGAERLASSRTEPGAFAPAPTAATHLAVVVAGERVEHAWPCFSREHGERILRVWYACRRTVFCLDNTIRLDDYALGGPAPENATVEQISDWYCDGVDGHYVTIFELKSGDPLEGALAELGEAPNYAEAVRAAVGAVREGRAEAAG